MQRCGGNGAALTKRKRKNAEESERPTLKREEREQAGHARVNSADIPSIPNEFGEEG